MGTLALGFDTRPAYVAIIIVNVLSFVAPAAMAAGGRCGAAATVVL